MVSECYEDKELETRRIIVKLNKRTRDGELEIGIFSNLPVEVADAIKAAPYQPTITLIY
jgi:hypothetical protein